MAQTVRMTEKTYRTPGGTIHYWVNPLLPGRPALVLLPGLTSDHRLFEAQIAAFAGQYNLVAWDAPGHGRSRPFRLDFTMAQKAAWLHEILQREGVRRPVLVGQSIGGYVAQCYLQHYPGQAGGFVAIDSQPIGRRYMTNFEFWLLNHMAAVYSLIPWRVLRTSAWRSVGVTPYARQNMRRMVVQYTRDEFCALMKHGFALMAGAVGADLPVPPCPTLLLCGEDDQTGSVRRVNPVWAETERLPLIWVPRAAHNANDDNPKAVNREIAQFVREELTES